MKKLNPKGPWVMITIALLLAVVILLLGYQSYQATEKATFNEFNQRQLVLATAAASGIELYFQSVAADIRAAGQVAGLQRFDETPARQEIQHRLQELKMLGVNDIGILDADGIVRYNAVAHQLEGRDFSWRTYYQEARKTTASDSYIVEFIEFKGVEAGQKGMLVAVPIFETATDNN